MKLYFTRHGECEGNVKQIIIGRMDFPLTERGRQQAAELAERTKDKPIDVILSSPLLRAKETAQAVAAVHNLPVIEEPLLIEACEGIYEGQHWSAEFWRHKTELFCHMPGGESYAEIMHRMYSVIDKVKREYAGKNVLLVSHNGIGRFIETYFHDYDMAETNNIRHDNCCFIEYEI